MREIKLIEAVKERNIDKVKKLCDAGAEINEQDDNGWTPLNYAAGKGDPAIVELLLEKGANVLNVGRDRRTPYMIALAAAHMDVARLLKEAEEKAGGGEERKRQERKYCKAYLLEELRKFPGWTESKINWQEKDKIGETVEGEGGNEGSAADSIAYLHQDFTVTQSIYHNENVIFNQVTPEWKRFCMDALKFKVPDDLDLITGLKPDGKE